MNPRHLVDQTTGQIIRDQVRQAAVLRVKRNGWHPVRAMRYMLTTARSEAYAWSLEHSAASSPMMYTGGRETTSTGFERSV